MREREGKWAASREVVKEREREKERKKERGSDYHSLSDLHVR